MTKRAKAKRKPSGLAVFKAWAVRLTSGKVDVWSRDSGMKGPCLLRSVGEVRLWLSGKPIRVKVTVEEI
jgi:hypothetical protein